jgi:hypothetical protein
MGLDYRLAFVLLAALVVGAAIPLAFAWARILPEDAPPFQIEPGSFPFIEEEPVPEAPPKKKRQFAGVLLLTCVTICFAIQFPGFPREPVVQWLSGMLDTAAATRIVYGVDGVLLAGTLGAGIYAVLHRGPLRVPLSTSAGLVLLLWALAPFLRAALSAA